MESLFNVVYIDRRARRDRVEYRSSDPVAVHHDDSNNLDPEHEAVRQNLDTLLSAFASVSVCTSGQSCISILLDINHSDPNPTLVLLDVPLLPQPDEDASHDAKHDSGIAVADLYGIPLLKFICSEMEHRRMSRQLVPVALLTDSKDGDCEARELQCVDNGACDVLKSPFFKENVKGLYMHCYRARKAVHKARKRSWVGLDEPKLDEYSYLREKMVSDLMTQILKPEQSNMVGGCGQIRVSTSQSKVIRESVGRWDFSAHGFSEDELVYCAQIMFEHAFTMPEVSDFIISSDRLVDFLLACRTSYNDKVPYHNFRHVVDVLQAVFFFLLQLGALPLYAEGAASRPPEHSQSLSQLLTPMDALTLLVVAIGHDVGHPGVNNAFLVTLKAPLALLYNDKSVLESFHCAAFSQVLTKHWPEMMVKRKTMIELILATDMGLHFDYMRKLDRLQEKYEKDGGIANWDEKTGLENRNLLCAMLVKCADISNVARHHECSAQWAEILIEEFSRQASMETELGIPTSLVAPPVTGSIVALAKSQVGFMGLFAIPLFESICAVLPEMDFSVQELAANKASWQHKIDLCSTQSDEVLDKMGERLASHKSSTKPKNTRPPEHASPEKDFLDQSHISRRHLPPVLGTALMDSDMSSGSTSAHESGGNARNGVSSGQYTNSSVNTTSFTVVVTHPNPSPSLTNGFTSKRPTYQHSTEHLRAVTPRDIPTPDRPRSSPPDLGDCGGAEHTCTKGCGTTTAVVPTNGTVTRRSSRFFKKVKLWKQRRKEPTDG